MKKVTVKASGSVVATGNSGALANNGHKGIHLVMDITAVTGGSPTLDVTIERFDSVSASWIAIPGAAFAQKNGTNTDDLIIYPGVAETANRSVSDYLTEDYRVVWTLGGASPDFTFSIGATLLN